MVMVYIFLNVNNMINYTHVSKRMNKILDTRWNQPENSRILIQLKELHYTTFLPSNTLKNC